jgi:hypothetical protein
VDQHLAYQGREDRDKFTEKLFLATYGSPPAAGAGRAHAEEVASKQAIERELDREVIGRHKLAEIDAKFEEGGLAEAVLRAIAYIRATEKSIDERGFAVMQEVYAECPPEERIGPAELKAIMRDQRALVLRNPKRALMTLPALLHESQDARDEALAIVAGSSPPAIRSRPKASAGSRGSSARSAALPRPASAPPARKPCRNERAHPPDPDRAQVADRRHRQRRFDRLRLRQGLPRGRRRPRGDLAQRQGPARTSSRWPTSSAPIKARSTSRRPASSRPCSTRSRALGQARQPGPFDRLRSQGGPAGRLLDCSAEGFAGRWTSRAIRSCAWPGWPRR